jgi:hydroxymethylpyrimidine pyrophosphatase-like HAD family hydrolase
MIKLILTDMDCTFLNNEGDFNRELFKQVKQLMTEKGVVFALCTGKQSECVEEIFGEDAAMIKNDLSPEESAAVRSSYKKVVTVADFGAIRDDFIKITVRDMQQRCVDTAEKLADYSDRAHIVASEKAWLDITDLNVHKGSTVARLQELLQVTPEETMVFGDGMNDIEMMKSGRYSFAVRNSRLPWSPLQGIGYN